MGESEIKSATDRLMIVIFFIVHIFSNCPDYDLCENCEQWSEKIHRPDHIFLKIKIPATRAGVNKKGKLRPLLKRNIYQHTSHSR